MNTIDVTTATNADRERIVSTMLLAFVNDPMTRWTYPKPHDYLTHWPELVQAMGGGAFEHGSAYYAGAFAGAALWLPPGVHADEAALGAIVERSVSTKILDVSQRIFEEMERYHPTEPYWHLPLLGVDPYAQGCGYGSALLAHALERIDEAQQLAALESTNSANIPLYERHGFEVTGQIQVADAPPLTPMVRRPR